MTIDKSGIPENGAECQLRKPGQEGQAEAERQPIPDRWSRRISFWRSVAGMALALALACAAIALETAFESSSRSASLHRRLELLGSRVSRLRTQAVDAEQQLAALHAERASGVSINRVLTAPDVVVVRLRDGATNARGLLALSSREGGAMVAISGLPAAPGQTCVMWWLLSKEPPVKAAQFNPDPDGRVSLAIRLPRGGLRIAGALVRIESGKLERGTGIVLKGALPRPTVLN